MDTNEMRYVYKVVSEWDIGEEYVMFGSETSAMEWLGDNIYVQEMIEAEGLDLVGLLDEGLLSIAEIEVIH